MGGMIIFPRKASINCARGRVVSDRVDLTIECIRRYFFKEKSPLSDVLEKNNDFFLLFGSEIDGFKAYIDFFFLNDIVSKDYTAVDVFIGKNDFSNSFAFIKARNNRIRQALSDGTIDARKS